MLTMGVVWEFLASGYELLPDFVKLVTVVIFTVPHNSKKPGNQLKNSNHSKMADVLLGKGKLKP